MCSRRSTPPARRWAPSSTSSARRRGWARRSGGAPPSSGRRGDRAPAAERARRPPRRSGGTVTDGARAGADQLLRAYQAQERRFAERRFPLRFVPEVPAIRELYSQAKGLRWNPETDIAWDRLGAERYAPETREAARRTWSRRAWGAYPGLGENTALLVRLCLESGAAGMDAKLFLSFRPAEEANHLETCFM